MDSLSIDFKSLLPYVIDAFSEVYGEEYQPIISQRVNNAIMVQYNDVLGLEGYLLYLKRCKAREFAIRFLDEIGMDVQKYKKSNYTEYLDDEIDEVLEYYIDSTYFGFSSRADYFAPLKAFNTANKADSERILKNKLKLINYLRGNGAEKITEENFDKFSKTKEYADLLNLINKYNRIYEKILSEYNEWVSKLLPYEKYIEYEKKRKAVILQNKKDEMFGDISSKLSPFVKNLILNKSLKEQEDIILGSYDIASTSIIDFFGQEQMDKLKSPKVRLLDKNQIISWQSSYLKKIGINIPDETMLKCESEDDVIRYLNFLNDDNVKKYLPSLEMINYISIIRKRKYEEALKEYYTTRKDFIDIMKIFKNNKDNFELIYDQIRNKDVCIWGYGGFKEDGEFVSIMFFTIRSDDGGSLLYSFMHECGHIIDQSQNGSGFESFEDFKINAEKNPYDDSSRKYEKFNEVLNDIFTMEAIEVLQRRGIYLIEPKEFTSLDLSNNNTKLITKNLLKPLVEKFRKQVIKAKVNTNLEELVKYIGEENFENLVDSVNKVDYLSRNGVISKIQNCPEDSMVKEYFEQVERVKKIYLSIDDYYTKNYGTLFNDIFDKSVKKI